MTIDVFPANNEKLKSACGIVYLIKNTVNDQIDPVNGVILGTFESIADAERSFDPNYSSDTGFQPIAHALSGITNFAHGFKWRYSNES